MARIRPIFGVRYGERISDYGLVVAPPYDVISKDQQKKLHERDPHNIVWIDCGMESGGESKYERARGYINQWKGEGTLTSDRNASLYYYEQEFDREPGVTCVRSGFICGLFLEKFGEGSVFPHESTLLSPKIDRLNLMKHTGHATSPIFGIYDDEDNRAVHEFRDHIGGGKPDVDVVDDIDVSHRLWIVDQQEMVSRVCAILKEKKVFIADGHHRYETALAYRDYMNEVTGKDPEGSWNYVMIFLSASGDEGLLILPTHRGVMSLNDEVMNRLPEMMSSYFDLDEIKGAPGDLFERVGTYSGRGHALGMITKEKKQYLLTVGEEDLERGEVLSDLPPEVRTLDITILHTLFLEKILGITREEISTGGTIRFYKERDGGLADLGRGEIDLFIYLNPVTKKQFMEVSKIGFLLPQKTTYFFPKILTGLVLFPVGEEDRIGKFPLHDLP